jgi:hypothetical protein
MVFSLNLLGFPYQTFYEFNLYGFLLMVSAMLFILMVSWFFRKEPFSFNLTKNQELDNYILNFDAKNTEVENKLVLKEFSLGSKLVVYTLSIILVIIPFSEFIQSDIFYFCFW